MSSIWKNRDFFLQSSYDDEEALKWATLEELPTYIRLKNPTDSNAVGKHGVREDDKQNDDGGHGVREDDIKNIELEERRGLLERVVSKDEKFLLNLRERIDRVQIELPLIEVRFEHLNVDGNVHVGSRALPNCLNYVPNLLKALLNYLHVLPSQKKHLSILRDVSGIIKPCRMTLLLGSPSSGKTTLLLALAGKLDRDLKVSGSIRYNGHSMHEFVPQRTSAYISQNDCHIGEMTVIEYI